MDEDDRAAIAVLQANARNTEANLVRVEHKVDVGFAELRGDISRLDDKLSSGFRDIKDESKRDLKWTTGLFLLAVGAMGSGFLWLAERLERPALPSQGIPAELSKEPAKNPP